MQSEGADFELLSGCFALVALLFAAGGGALWRSLWVRRVKPSHDHLLRLMAGYVSGEYRTLERVAQIEDLLIAEFGRDRRYEEVTAAVIAFASREKAAFRDEAGLVEVFQAFLKRHKVIMPEEAPDQNGVWPPPPKR